MAVYVDQLKEYPLGAVSAYSHRRAKYWCHMWADTLEELHDMAQRIGMKRTWFQDHRVIPHYDLAKRRRIRAIKLGAIESSPIDWLRQKMR